MSIPSIQFEPEFVPKPDALFHALRDTTAWDDRMRARRTATFGAPYNYSGMVYPESPMPPALQELCDALERRLCFRPNNCLANYYVDGRSTMGFHADSIKELTPGTGVAIVSLGAARSLVFRRIEAWDTVHDYRLTPGSLLYMPPEVQLEWKHGVPEEKGAEARISLTFRCLRPS